eukprot:838399-Alexandrium_andersonii.AAC.1
MAGRSRTRPRSARSASASPNGIYALGILTTPARGANSLAQSVGTDGDGEWAQVQSRGTARRVHQPQKSACAD